MNARKPSDVSLTDRRKFLQSIRGGASLVNACAILGIGKTTAYGWLERGRGTNTGRLCSECDGKGVHGRPGPENDEGAKLPPCLHCWGSGMGSPYRAFADGYDLSAGIYNVMLEVHATKMAIKDARMMVFTLRNRMPHIYRGMNAPAEDHRAGEGGDEKNVALTLQQAQIRKALAEAEAAEAKAEVARALGAGGLVLVGLDDLLDDPELPAAVRDALEGHLRKREIKALRKRDLTKADE